jgi:peptidoglycan/LPS O-acetylase OafA/YrhL
MSAESSRSGRLVSVDVLRALAASWVVLHHVPFRPGTDVSVETGFWLSVPFRFGYLGVTLFLVLSGFCIHLAVARRMGEGEGMRGEWGRFWKRRFWRLYPPYLAAIALSVVVLLGWGAGEFSPPGFRELPLGWDLLAHLGMVHNLLADYWRGLGNSPFWSLGLEEQLYALYPIYLLLRRRWPAGRVAGLILAIGLVWCCGCRVLSGPADWGGNGRPLEVGPVALGQWMMWPFAWWFAWVLGALAAEQYTGYLRLPRWCSSYRVALALAVAGLACNRIPLQHACILYPRVLGRVAHAIGLEDLTPLLLAAAGVSEVLFGVAAFVVLNRWVRDEGEGAFRSRGAGVLAALGVISYSLYLTHVPVIHFLAATADFGDGLAATAARFVVMVPACLAVAALFFWAVERHFLHTKPRPAAAPTPAPAVSGSAVPVR